MRVSFFAWEAVRDKILTVDQLKRRGWSLPSKCYLCKGKEESAKHILLHYPKAIMLWHLVFAMFGVQWVMPLSIKDALFSWWVPLLGRKEKRPEEQLLCAYFGLYERRETKEPLKIQH